MGIVMRMISPTLAASNEVVHRGALFLVKKWIDVFCFLMVKERAVMRNLSGLLSGYIYQNFARDHPPI